MAAAMPHSRGPLLLGGFAGSTSVSTRLSMVLLMTANTKWTGLGYETALEELTDVTYPI
jgi:hypothetical protein